MLAGRGRGRKGQAAATQPLRPGSAIPKFAARDMASAPAWAEAGVGSSMRDPYTVLGVAKSANADDIKKAYRKLAKKFHPDHNKTDPKAQDKFAEVNQAYEILGEEAKRAQFDRGEIDGAGKPRGFEGFGAGGPGGFRRGGAGGFEHHDFNMGGGSPFGGGVHIDPSEIFADLFGGARGGAPGGARGRTRAAPRGEDVQATLTVPLEEAVAGGKARVILPTGRTLEVSIPAGIEEGKQIRLKGQGQSGPGMEAGDAIVTVKIGKHPYFRVDGRDLRLDLPLTLYEAVLGGKVEVPTLGGAVEMTLPPKSNGGRTLRLRGKGLPAQGSTPAGDLFVTLRVMLPDTIDADLQALAQRLRDEKPWNPRTDLG